MRTPKTLALFFDGTWNRPEQFKKPTGPEAVIASAKSWLLGDEEPQTALTDITNVLKLMRAVLASTDGATTCKACGHPGTPVLAGICDQVSLYLPGVGTQPYHLPRFLEGAFGYGIDDNIQRGYQFITQNFIPGDHIFLFGFSRGAFTARSLAGFLDIFGFIAPSEMSRLPEIYRRYEEAATEGGRKAAKDFAAKEVRKFETGWRSEAQIPVWFLGVWDTVGALWRVNRKLARFHQVELPPNVSHAYQALALHEVRSDFDPVLWTKIQPGQIVEQVWFPGAHADVGGGYPETESAASDVALKWMACKAMSAGLALDTGQLARGMLGKTTQLHDSHAGQVGKWSFHIPRPILREQFQDPDDFWPTIRVHQTVLGASVRTPSGNSDGKRLLRNAQAAVDQQVVVLKGEVDPPFAPVSDTCGW